MEGDEGGGFKKNTKSESTKRTKETAFGHQHTESSNTRYECH